MTYSDDCVNLVKESEGFAAHAYKDAAGYGTIGYGHKIKEGEEFGDGLTVDEAEALLKDDLNVALEGVNRLVKVPLTQGQTDALTDWVFNLGAGALQTSTLLRKLNMGQYDQIPAEIVRWVYAGGNKLSGLITRRQKEVELWNSQEQA